MMTWEETIQFIRTKPEFENLVNNAYLEENLVLNIERFKNREEYLETLKLIKRYAPCARRILDVGSGNGVTAVSFALDGYIVTACEPDRSETIGTGAIRKLKDHYQLKNLEVYEAFAEDIDLNGKLFDIVYVRQAMHHAYDLEKFISNLARHLNKGGLLVTVRDHIIYNDEDKKWFLENHPLQKFYGGENAFTEAQYTKAFLKAGLKIKILLKHYDSVINYFPISKEDKLNESRNHEADIDRMLSKRLNFIGRLKIVQLLYKRRIKFSSRHFFDEKKVPGRMYSFIAQK